MKLNEAKILYEELASYFGCDFNFSFMERRNKFNLAGECNYKKKVIRLQPTFVERNYPVVVKWTILHEIAHALKPKHGHNKFWKMTAKSIGCSGNRYYGKYVKKN